MVERKIYMEKIESFLGTDLIKIITGVRRCGKSFFLNLIVEKLIEDGVSPNNILFMDLELPNYRNMKSSLELDEIVLDFINMRQNEKIYLFFDEIQNIPDWELSINSYYKLKNTEIFLTGSNSKLLSSELATYLTGRYVSIEMFPFSFNEFIEYKKELNEEPIVFNEVNNELENYFEEYLSFGGFPVAIASRNHKEVILNDLYSSIILNDIVDRYQIRNVGLFNRIMKFLIENIGNLISVNSVYKYLIHDNVQITKNTLYNYLAYLENALILSKISREDLISKKEITGSEKIYLTDQGFYKSQLEEKQLNIGRIIENIVYLELMRHDFKVTVGSVGKYEIDFVCRKNNKKYYVQVAYSLSDEKTVEREFRPLMKVNDNYPKYVISMDKLDFSREGIIHLNLINFLRNFEDVL